VLDGDVILPADGGTINERRRLGVNGQISVAVAVREDGRRYLYAATVPAAEARVSALRRVVTTFFGGSATEAALALMSEAAPTPEELRALEDAVARARQEGR
jgi:predicted transcriptional regulator